MANDIKQTVFIEASLTQIQGQLKTLEGNFRGTFESIKGAAAATFGALGIGLGIVELVQFGKEVIHTAAMLEDLSQKTGMSGQALSALKPIAEMSGSSIEDFANGLTRALRNLADTGAAGDKARKTLSDLGISAQQMSQFTAEPEKFVAAIADKLAAIDNPAKRASVAFDVMGRSGANLIPTLLRLAESARELGGFDKIKLQGMDDSTIRSLKQFDDSMVSIKNSLINIAALPLAELAKFFRSITGAPSNEDTLKNLNVQINALMNTQAKLVSQKRPMGLDLLPPDDPRVKQFDADMATRSDAIQAQLDPLVKQRDAIQGVVDALNKPYKPIDPVSDKSVEKLQKFRDELNQMLLQAQAKAAGVFGGPLEEKATQLDLMVKKFKQSFREANEPLPPGFSAFEAEFQNKIKPAILAADDAAIKAKFDFDRLMETLAEMSGETSVPSPRGVTNVFSLQEIDQQKSAAQEYIQMIQQLATQSIITDPFNPDAAERQRRIDAVKQEYDQRVLAIQKWFTSALDANVNATTSEELRVSTTIQLEQDKNNLLTAADAARNAALRNMNDETTQFEIRAFQKMQDALSGIFSDFLSGNIKGWQELGTAVKKVIDSIVSEWLGMQLKTALFGSTTGGPSGGSGVGGLLGQGLGWLSQMFGGAAPGGFAGATSATFLSAFPDFHAGGVVGESGHPMHFGDMSMFANARRYARGTNFLLPNEVPIIAHVGEKITPAGRHAGGGSGGDVYNFSFQGVENIDSFRRSRPQLLADLTRAVEKGKKHL